MYSGNMVLSIDRYEEKKITALTQIAAVQAEFQGSLLTI